MRHLVAALLAGFFLCDAVVAGAKTLDCTIKPDNNVQGWIGNRSIITWDESAATAEVMDDIIYYFNDKKPMQAKVKVVSAKQTAFSWTVTTTDSTGQYAQMFYRAVFFPADQKLVISSKPGGYINDYVGRGPCTVQ